MTTHSLITTIQAFADLAARLDDPFGDRDAVMTAAALDEEGWRKLVRHWTEVLSRDGDGAGTLGPRFAEAYALASAAARAARAKVRPESAAARSATGFTRERAAPAWLHEAPIDMPTPATPSGLPTCLLLGATTPQAQPSSGNDADETAELRALPTPVVWPFRCGLATPPLPSELGRSAAEVDAEGDTIEAAAVGDEPAWPFSDRPPMSPYAATTAGRRLMFFDPQTGQRLPFPVWADTPGNDSKPPSSPPRQ